jgi:protein subunit release factor A
VAEQLDSTLTARLREALANRPATETELRTLCEQADGWARALQAQIEASEQRLRELTDEAASLTEIAAELRRVETLAPELTELRELLSGLDDRARELRTNWLRHQMDSLTGGE